jgi:tetratricopeptide (TPR) repeat protein
MFARAGRTCEPTARLSIVPRALVGVVLIALAAGTSALYLSDAKLPRARDAIGENPQRQLDLARSAARFNPLAVQPLYLQAGALETMGRRRDARDVLLGALEKEPENSATFGLLGDFAARGGKYEAARRWYGRALARNPIDVGLKALARTGGRPG